MTEPEDDVTELSARIKNAEDVTLLSRRGSAPAPAPEPDEEDDFTRFSPRTPSAAMPAPDAETEDQTRISRRSGEIPSAPPSSRRGVTLSALPPGAVGGAAAERGSFGQPAEEYDVRELPIDAPAAPQIVADPVPASTAPDAAKVRERREAARHRRLITAVVVVGVTAAIMTAAILVIFALVSGD